MNKYDTFSNTTPVLLQRPSDDTRNLQLHRCISMSSAADPSSDLRTNSTIGTLGDDLSSTIVIRTGLATQHTRIKPTHLDAGTDNIIL